METTKKKQFYLKCVILVLYLINQSSSDQPVKNPWPNTFTQSFIVSYQGKYTTGQFWYDWNKKSQRTDYSDSSYLSAECSQHVDFDTPCVVFHIETKVFYYYPQEELCCLKGFTSYIENSTQKVKNFKYNSTVNIDGSQFYLWTDPYGSLWHTTKDERQIFRRYENGITIDWFVNSYDEMINDNTFLLPSYCSQQIRCKKIVNLKKQ